jgi:hypothetical protein
LCDAAAFSGSESRASIRGCENPNAAARVSTGVRDFVMRNIAAKWRESDEPNGPDPDVECHQHRRSTVPAPQRHFLRAKPAAIFHCLSDVPTPQPLSCPLVCDTWKYRPVAFMPGASAPQVSAGMCPLAPSPQVSAGMNAMRVRCMASDHRRVPPRGDQSWPDTRRQGSRSAP